MPCDVPPIPENPSEFAERAIPVLSSTPLHTPGLCHGHWQWFQLLTTGERNVTTHSREPMDGVVRTVRGEATVTETQAVVIQFDTMWVAEQNRYATSDVIVVNGLDALATMPTRYDIPATFNPGQAAARAEPGTVYWRPNVDSLTLTLGYNTTLGGEGCAALLHPLVLIGVRCSWGAQSGFGCPFDLAATLVPRQISDGDVVSAPIEPDGLHYFAIDVGSFDVLSVSLRRLERHATYEDAQTGETRAHVDHGLLGNLIASRGVCPDPSNRPPPPPPPHPPFPSLPDSTLDGAAAAAYAAEAAAFVADLAVAPIVNTSATANLSFFCTTAPLAGRYAIAVHAAAVQTPLGLVSTGTGVCTDGYVGPTYAPLYISLAPGGAAPQCNPNGINNELKPNRPLYELSVSHQPFADGALAPFEVRPGCLSYGQWRRYTVRATGEEAALLFVALSQRVSHLLIQEGAPPTPELSDAASSVASAADVASADAASAGADSAEAMSVSVAPRDPFVARTWHVGVYLAEQAEAEAHGLAPTTFDIESRLTAARQQLGTTITPRAAGGEGSVCCGRMVHFVVRMNNSEQALRARLNVTRGAVRAVYLRAGSAPTYPDDIEEANCVGDCSDPLDVVGSSCVGDCAVTWFTSFDRYTGVRRFAQAETSIVPYGAEGRADLRQAAEWFVSVQDMGIAPRTDFELVLDAIVPAVPSVLVACNRFGRFDCSNDVWLIPPDLVASAAHRTTAAPAASAPALLALVVTWLSARLTRRRLSL